MDELISIWVLSLRWWEMDGLISICVWVVGDGHWAMT